MPAPLFVPEVPHARLSFDVGKIPRDALLAGDGYSRYVKPFRTLEDVYVHAAILANLVRESRHLQWRSWMKRAMTALVALVDVARREPSNGATPVGIASALYSAARRRGRPVHAGSVIALCWGLLQRRERRGRPVHGSD